MNESFNKIKQEVFKKRPVLAEILKAHGQESLTSYVSNSWLIPKIQPDSVFLNIFRQELEKIYNKSEIEKIISQLAQKPLVSTIDHLGIWNHPIFVNSSLIYSLHFKPEEFAVVLATESVSLNNTSSWSGSLLWHNKDLKQERYSFFPDKQKNLPVFSTPSITSKNIEKINSASKGLFKDFFKKINLKNLNTNTSFSLQASKLSSSIWAEVFPSAPKLVYFPLESLIIEYLLEAIKNKEHIISRLIQSEDIWKKYFASDSTVMFWGIDELGKRLALQSLPNNLEELLKNRKIYPSSTLCFIVLLQAGLACVGGFTQTTWLTEIKEKFLAIIKELSLPTLQIEKIPTKNFAESSLALLKMVGGIINPTSLDLFFQNKDYYPVYLQLANKLTVEQSLNLTMPTIYSVVVPKAEQTEAQNSNRIENELIEHYKIKEFLEG